MGKTYRIKDIAEMSGVSTGTVDRILHNRGKVSEEAQKKVEKVLKEIGEFEQLIVFCDLYGGSVMQEVFRQTINDERDIQIIAGYNLALVLDIILRNAVLTKEEIQEIIDANKEAIVYVDRVVETSADEDLF